MDGNKDEDKDEDEDQDEDEPIHQSLSARLRSTAFTGGSKSVTRKLGDDQNFTHFCHFVVNTFGFTNPPYFVSVVDYFLVICCQKIPAKLFSMLLIFCFVVLALKCD